MAAKPASPSTISLQSVLILGAIVIVTLLLSLLSFAKKAALYTAPEDTINLSVQKELYKVSSPSTGLLSRDNIQLGQHLKKGDVIATIDTSGLENQIKALESLGSANASAQLQIAELKLEEASDTILAPADGVIASVESPGAYVNPGSSIATLYSDSGIIALGSLTAQQYGYLQRNGAGIKAYDRRLDQTYDIHFQSLKQNIESEGDYRNLTGVYFSFDNPQDTINLLQNESLTLLFNDKVDQSTKPIDRIIRLYRRFSQNASQTQ